MKEKRGLLMREVGLVLSSLCILFTCYAGNAAAYETVEGYFIDQGVTVDGGRSRGYIPDTIFAQSFVPTANLVAAVSFTENLPNIIVEIRTDSQGFPSDTILGSTSTISILSPYERPGFIFNPPISVTPGETYYIIFYKSPSATEDVKPWATDADAYVNGHAYYKNLSGQWTKGVPPMDNPWWDACDDYYFKEYFYGQNTIPVADAGDDLVAGTNETLTLDASASFDPDGSIVTYSWSRLPDNFLLYSGPDAKYDTKALGRAEEIIMLTVADNRGASSNDTMAILNKKLKVVIDKANQVEEKLDRLDRQINPTFYISSPSDGATVSGMVSIDIALNNEDGLGRCYFYVDDRYIGYDGIAPFSVNWDSRRYINGMHKIKAVGNFTNGVYVTKTTSISVNSQNPRR